jgi:sarcosine oxidase, subunit delta
MLLIYCPYCEEERSELEFRHGGDAHIARPTNMADITDEEFQEFFFNAARDTVSDKFVMSYKAGEPKPDLPGVAPATEKTVETYEATEGTAK